MNKLLYGDNLDILRKLVRDETVYLSDARRLILSVITIRFAKADILIVSKFDVILS
ncbi:MAG: hypothetical protein M3Q99_20720 [Acidobacteriota bacterium]|nr:hypothetical protein [Acidobacteriota bacterium]